MIHTFRAWLAVLLALLVIGPARAVDGVPAIRVIDFDIVRQGSTIGRHKINFSEQGERLIVDIDVTVKVDVAFITVYRFTHRSREVWEGGRLIAMTATSNDDGAPHELAVELRDGAFAIMHNGTASRLPAGLVPTSLWNPATLKQTVLLDSVEGDTMPTTVTPLGKSTIDTPAGSVAAEGFLVDARPDFTRRVWYSPAGTLIAVSLTAQDGSEVLYRLR
jgi:hypothetical protein